MFQREILHIWLFAWTEGTPTAGKPLTGLLMIPEQDRKYISGNRLRNQTKERLSCTTHCSVLMGDLP